MLLRNPRDEVVRRLLYSEGRVLEEAEELRETKLAAFLTQQETATCLIKRVAHNEELRRDVAHETSHDLEDRESRAVALTRVCGESASDRKGKREPRTRSGDEQVAN